MTPSGVFAVTFGALLFGGAYLLLSLLYRLAVWIAGKFRRD
jgi:hypothetical protein